MGRTYVGLLAPNNSKDIYMPNKELREMKIKPR